VAAARPPSRLSYGAVAAGVGGLLLIISLFIAWYGNDFASRSAFEFFDITDIFLFLVGLCAVAFAAIEAMGANVNLPFNRVRALTVLGIIASSIVWVFLIEGDNRKFGIILAALASLAILAGGILAERSPSLGVANPAANVGGPGGGIGPGPGGGGGYGQPQAPAAPAPAAPAPAAADPAAAAPAAGGGQPADWYPDPRGEKRLRYWDGSQWTDHTAD
jgi:hypothetical protein